MTPVFLLLSLALNAGLIFFLGRAIRRLLQFDMIWEQIMPVLFTYSEDLRKMLSADLLVDNPEVLAFHRRNVRALLELDEITRVVQTTTPTKEKSRLPRPDME